MPALRDKFNSRWHSVCGLLLSFCISLQSGTVQHFTPDHHWDRLEQLGKNVSRNVSLDFQENGCFFLTLSVLVDYKLPVPLVKITKNWAQGCPGSGTSADENFEYLKFTVSSLLTKPVLQFTSVSQLPSRKVNKLRISLVFLSILIALGLKLFDIIIGKGHCVHVLAHSVSAPQVELVKFLQIGWACSRDLGR